MQGGWGTDDRRARAETLYDNALEMTTLICEEEQRNDSDDDDDDDDVDDGLLGSKGGKGIKRGVELRGDLATVAAATATSSPSAAAAGSAPSWAAVTSAVSSETAIRLGELDVDVQRLLARLTTDYGHFFLLLVDDDLLLQLDQLAEVLLFTFARFSDVELRSLLLKLRQRSRRENESGHNMRTPG